ncbi:twin-arginine translocase TatA/TatE family subunit [Nocardia cerradoensis]|nr:twin-arginine translocase TatA/TatE family subunit [Nocardia cerradoensis]NKY43870.1 twin-arginine translocase TatA/TatE family subunit [Nocardia cerradoensis]
MGSLSPTHWLIIALVVVVLFGAKRLPDTARGTAAARATGDTLVRRRGSAPELTPWSGARR